MHHAMRTSVNHHEDEAQERVRRSLVSSIAFTRCPNNPSSTRFTITNHYRIFIRIYFGYPNKKRFETCRRFIANKCKTDANISGRTRQ